MNKKLLSALILFSSLLSSLPAFAGGGSSIGPSACSFARVACHTNEASVADQTWVCVFNGSENTLFALVVDSEVDSSFQNLELQPIPQGEVGAPQIYSGEGFKLVYVDDAAERPGYLTVPSLDLHKLSMSCS